MKITTYLLALSFFVCLFILTSCSKNDQLKNDSIVGSYSLVKVGVVENGKFIQMNSDVKAELTLLSDNSFRITYTSEGQSTVEIGTYNPSTKSFTPKDEEPTYYYFDNGYLVLVTEVNGNSLDVGYFKKK